MDDPLSAAHTADWGRDDLPEALRLTDERAGRIAHILDDMDRETLSAVADASDRAERAMRVGRVRRPAA